MKKIKDEFGEDSEEYKALFFQYKKLENENAKTQESNLKHWEGGLAEKSDNIELRGLERLYCRSLVIEPTKICAAHCRYCLRAHYDLFTLKENDLKGIAEFCGSKNVKDNLAEVLITGGDPLIIPQRLHLLVELLLEKAPNIRIIRIGSRLMTQDPERVDNNVYGIFKNKPGIRFEIGTQINHPIEFFEESIETFKEFFKLGVKIYSQNILLRNINDNINCLIKLYDIMRELDIEPHYLFHCVPMRGMHHFRTTVTKGIELTKSLVNSGYISGRAKPMFALMTDIGKIIPYEGTILRKNSFGQILIQSAYKYQDRMRWNPYWELPKTAEIDDKGYLRVWYLDGED